MSQPIDVGSTLGPFQITGELGSGGAGSVYKARHHETGKEVALKTLMPETSVNEEIHSRFIREISVAQKIGHPNIVAYDDCGVDDDVLYYTMELVPWGSLADVLAHKRQIPWREAVECGIQICRGLEHLHGQDIVHRDLKPANIFLSDDGRLKLGDFGLARDFNATRLTISGHTVGTAKYLSPEQAMAAEEIDGRSDLYAVGCILFELLAGRPPFKDTDGYVPISYYDMMARHVKEQPPALSDLMADCPDDLNRLVGQLLEKDPANRPQTANDVASMLQAILDGEPIADLASEGTDDDAKSLTERLHEFNQPNKQVSWPALAAVLLVISGVIGLAVAAQ